MPASKIVDAIEARYGQGGFPVSPVLPALIESLQNHPLCALTAPPGSGKTLFIPAGLLEHADFPKVWVLEPRRVTARLPALALREVLGDLVGYRIRFESLWEPAKTRIGYLTYGTALRRFFSHPPSARELVVFDEFHERSWEAELLLAYLRHLEQGPKILLMSATLDTESLPPELPLLESQGRLHEVKLSWETIKPQILGKRDRLAALVAQRSVEWAQRVRAEQLIFLPGLADIRAVEQKLKADAVSGPVDILHSSLPEQEIRRVVERSREAGFRRILSTDIAESSVTLPGIEVVLDAGLVRRPLRDRLDLGITLRTMGAPLSALEQRAGRAGRMGPGYCHRLFTREEELHRPPFPLPEMAQACYKTVALFLASSRLLQHWNSLPWLYAPDQEKLEESQAWCREQKLIGSRQELTPLGRQVLSLPLEPRVACFALAAKANGLASEQIVDLCQALERPPNQGQTLSLQEWSGTLKREGKSDKKLHAVLKRALAPVEKVADKSLAEILLPVFSDTLAQLTSDRAVCARPEQEALETRLPPSPDRSLALLLSASPSGGSGPRSLLTQYHSVSEDLVWEQLFDQMEEVVSLHYDRSTRSVKSERKLCLGQLVLERSVKGANPSREAAQLLLQHLSPEDLGENFLTLSRRLELLFTHFPEKFPDFAESFQAPLELAGLRENLLLSYLSSRSRWSKDSPGELLAHIQGFMPYSLQQFLDRELPCQVNLPRRKSPAKISYPHDGTPYVASKLQDFFGWQQPKLLGGKVDLVCRLLAPNGRACQITTDLQSFWTGSYSQVRKDLRGRYPKHDWPEKPP